MTTAIRSTTKFSILPTTNNVQDHLRTLANLTIDIPSLPYFRNSTKTSNYKL